MGMKFWPDILQSRGVQNFPVGSTSKFQAPERRDEAGSIPSTCKCQALPYKIQSPRICAPLLSGRVSWETQGNLGVDEKILLKGICKCDGVGWSLIAKGMVGFYGYNIQLFGSIKSRDFLTTLATITGPGQLSRYSDSLRAGRSGDRIPVGARFSAPVQTGPGATQSPIHGVPCHSRG